MKAKIATSLQDARKVSLCADIWTKKGMSSSYLGVTAHFFSPKDHLRHCVTLAVRRMPSPHTAENVRAVVQEVLSEWEIPSGKVSAILTDNGSNMVASFRQHFQREESEDDKNTDGEEDDKDEENEATTEAEAEDFETREFDHQLEFSPMFKRLSCFSLLFSL